MKKIAVAVMVMTMVLTMVSAQMATAASYTIDERGTFTAHQDMLMTVRLQKVDVVVGLYLCAGTTFDTQEMTRLTLGIRLPASASEYNAAAERYQAIGPNGATLVVRQLNQLVEERMRQRQDQIRYQRDHPDLGQRLERNFEYHLEGAINDQLWRLRRELWR